MGWAGWVEGSSGPGSWPDLMPLTAMSRLNFIMIPSFHSSVHMCGTGRRYEP